VKTWEQYDNIILVHGVRFKDELAYAELIEAFRAHEYFGEFAHKLKYVQVVTRDEVPGTLRKRIPQLLEDGELERETGVRIDPERARIMICGNPEMVDDLRKHFLGRGYTLSRRGHPGTWLSKTSGNQKRADPVRPRIARSGVGCVRSRRCANRSGNARRRSWSPSPTSNRARRI
jgi:NAD(P)H-flavin reductase